MDHTSHFLRTDLNCFLNKSILFSNHILTASLYFRVVFRVITSTNAYRSSSQQIAAKFNAPPSRVTHRNIAQPTNVCANCCFLSLLPYFSSEWVFFCNFLCMAQFMCGFCDLPLRYKSKSTQFLGFRQAGFLRLVCLKSLYRVVSLIFLGCICVDKFLESNATHSSVQS